MKTYSKPAMNRHVLVSRNSIAKKCWGYTASGQGSPTWWYDKNGTANGFVRYWIPENSSGDCGDINSCFVVEWFYNRADLDNDNTGTMVGQGVSITTDYGETVYPFDETMAYLAAAGGNEGQPFSGIDSLIKDNDSMG